MILRQFLHTEPVGGVLSLRLRRQVRRRRRRSGRRHRALSGRGGSEGLRILYVIDTHLHADHVSAGRALAAAAGAEYVLFADADAAFPFRGVRDGDELELGNVVVKVLHTPATRLSTSRSSLQTGHARRSRGSS